MGAHKIGSALAVVLIAGLGGWLRFRGIGYGMQGGGYRPDEGFVIEAALDFAQGDVRLPLPIYPMFLSSLLGAVFWLWRVQLSFVQGIPWNETVEVLRSRDLADARYAARLVCATFGTLTILETFRLALSLRPGPREAAYAAAASFILAVNFLHVRDSHFVGFDVVAGFLIVLSARKAIGAIHGNSRDEVLSAIAAGLAVSTRYQAVFAAVIPLLPTLARSLGHHGARAGGWPPVVRGLLRQASIVVLVFAVTSPMVIIESAKVVGAVAQFGFSLDFNGATGFSWLFGQFLLAAFGEHGRWLVLSFLIGAPLAAGIRAVHGWTSRAQAKRGSDLVPFAHVLLLLPVYLALAKFCSQKTVFIRYGTGYLPLLIVGAVLACSRAPSAALRTLSLLLTIPVLSLDPFARSMELGRILAADDTRELFDERLAELNIDDFPFYVPDTLLYPIPAGLWRKTVVGFTSCDRLIAALAQHGEGFLLSASHPLTYFVPEPPPWMATLMARSERVLTVDLPFRVSHAAPVLFEKIDAFFVPFAGLGAVERGGPALTLHRVLPRPEDAGLCGAHSPPLGRSSADASSPGTGGGQ